MRWIFFVLLGANVLLLGWQFLGPGRAQAPAPAAPRSNDSVPALELLGEQSSPSSAVLPQGREASDAPGDAPRDEGAVARDPAKEHLCVLVGPYEDADEAGALVERLAAMSVAGEVAEVEIPTGPGYWVYIAPFESRREALRNLNELQAQGVDSYIIPRGDLRYGISLGMFSRETLAHARVREMAELGIPAEIEVIERSYKEIWVSIPAAEARQLGDRAWDRLLEGGKSVDRRQNFCLHVASKDNFH